MANPNDSLQEANTYDDPMLGFSFYIEIDDQIEGCFTSCTGLSAKREVMTYQEGGINDFVHSLPGRVSYGNITLKRGIAFSDKLWTWFASGFAFSFASLSASEAAQMEDRGNRGNRNKALSQDPLHRKISIFQCVPYTINVARQYDLEEAFPVSWTGPDLNTASNEVAVESIEIAFRKFTVQNYPKKG